MRLRDESNIIGIKAEIAQMLKSQALTDIDTKYAEYTTALRNLIRESLNLAITKYYADDLEVTQLKAQVDDLMLSVATPANAKYYDLSDVYDTIADFFTKKYIKL